MLIILVLAGCRSNTTPQETQTAPTEPAATSEIGVSMEVLPGNDATADPQQEKAIAIVKALPEVQEWLGLFSETDGTSKATGGKPVFTVENADGNMYTVHAYEAVRDHSATFNWYDVDVDTGEAKSMF
ncbi:hypothetical protein KJ835_00195 [Patescibacteria group bacterium]|nr:hypothetical protein [Patescibacteria group bacterium]